jgi:hypothetical protein
MQCPDQPEANGILLGAISHNNGAAQIWYLQQVQESMGSQVSGEDALVNYPGTQLFEPAASWIPVMGDIGYRLFGNFWKLAAFGKF